MQASSLGAGRQAGLADSPGAGRQAGRCRAERTVVSPASIAIACCSPITAAVHRPSHASLSKNLQGGTWTACMHGTVCCRAGGLGWAGLGCTRVHIQGVPACARPGRPTVQGAQASRHCVDVVWMGCPHSRGSGALRERCFGELHASATPSPWGLVLAALVAPGPLGLAQVAPVIVAAGMGGARGSKGEVGRRVGGWVNGWAARRARESERGAGCRVGGPGTGTSQTRGRVWREVEWRDASRQTGRGWRAQCKRGQAGARSGGGRRRHRGTRAAEEGVRVADPCRQHSPKHEMLHVHHGVKGCSKEQPSGGGLLQAGVGQGGPLDWRRRQLPGFADG